jgi:hypothetical protein
MHHLTHQTDVRYRSRDSTSQTYSASNPTRGTGRAIWIVGIGADLGNLGGVLAHAA